MMDSLYIAWRYLAFSKLRSAILVSSITLIAVLPMARGYLAVSSGNITDEMIEKYIDDQEGEPVSDDSRFQIDP